VAPGRTQLRAPREGKKHQVLDQKKSGTGKGREKVNVKVSKNVQAVLRSLKMMVRTAVRGEEKAPPSKDKK